MGLFVENIYDLNFSEQSFKCNYWIWFNSTNDSLGLPYTIEVIKNKNVSREFEFVGKSAGINWSELKLKTEIVKGWNISNFPFDKQRLHVETEIIEDNTNALYLELDSINCAIDPSLAINEWKITHIQFGKKINRYNTNFGDPLNSQNDFYSVYFECEISRNVLGLFVKLFIGVFVAAAIALASLFISPRHSDPRYGIPVGALFASIGNKYIVDSIIPQTTDITLVDKIHFLTFVLIMTVIIFSIISQRYFETGKKSVSCRIDRLSFCSLLLVFISIIFIWIV